MIKEIYVNPEAIDGDEIEPFKFHQYVKSGDAYLLYEDGTWGETTIAELNKILEKAWEKLKE